MQERKNKISLIALIALTAIATVLYYFRSSKTSDIERSMFKVEGLAEIDKVELLRKDEKVVLEFDGTRWRVNGSHDADDRLITVLFATIDQVEVKRSVASKIEEAVLSQLDEHGVSVSLFTKDNLVRSFQVGGNESKTESYIGDKDYGPFVMTIPGYRVYASGVFEVDALGWRDKRIFNFNWRNFKGLTSTSLMNSSESFEVALSDNGFDILGSVATDTTKLNDYLDAVSLLSADHFVASNTNDSYDSIASLPPSLTIKVFDLGNNAYTLELHEPSANRNNVVGKMGDGTLSIFTLQQVLPVLKNRSYFRVAKP